MNIVSKSLSFHLNNRLKLQTNINSKKQLLNENSDSDENECKKSKKISNSRNPENPLRLISFDDN